MNVDRRVRDLMTSRLRSARTNDTASELDVWMTAGQFRHLPVVDDNGQLVGIVSRRDLARVMGGTKARPDHRECIFAEQIMSAPVETIGPDEPLAAAARRMMDGKISCLLVVDGPAVVGVLTETDFVRFVAGQ